MSAWFYSLSIFWMAFIVLGAIYLYAATIYLVVTRLAVDDRARAFKGISPGILPPLAIIFALLVAFLATQVWNEIDRASTAVNREASALRGLVLLAAEFPGEPEKRFRNLVQRHIQDAVEQEWPAMGEGKATLTIVPRPMAEALHWVLALKPGNGGQAIAQRELIASIQNALEARRQRIILSDSSINGVKWAALLVQAGLTLIAIALVHSDNPAANRIILTLFSTAVAMAVLMLASHGRPFTGEVSVRPTALLQIMPEAEN